MAALGVAATCAKLPLYYMDPGCDRGISRDIEQVWAQ